MYVVYSADNESFQGHGINFRSTIRRLRKALPYGWDEDVGKWNNKLNGSGISSLNYFDNCNLLPAVEVIDLEILGFLAVCW